MRARGTGAAAASSRAGAVGAATAILALLVSLAMPAPAARATFPGRNGDLAFGATLPEAAPPPPTDGAIHCAYLEAGPAGPPGNVLRIEDDTTHFTDIYVHHGDVLVASSEYRGVPADCEGEQATVSNIDRIAYTAAVAAPEINGGGDGPLAPGATPEPEGSEIEVSVHEEYAPQRLRVAGTQGPDTIEVGQRGQETVDVDLNARADGGSPDPDVTLVPFYGPSGTAPSVRIEGRGGDDTISALGDGFSTPALKPYALNGLVLQGGAGDDRLTGGPGKDRLIGGPGDDVMLGGGGRDSIAIGPGRDLVKGGAGDDMLVNDANFGGGADSGADTVLGGTGNDRVEVANLHRGDRVNCGRGRRDRATIDPGDRTRGCERVETSRP